MKIVIFTENTHAGGMDTFYTNLINFWPFIEDDLVFVCNESHPGLSNILKALRRPCRVRVHNIPLNWRASGALFGWMPKVLRRATQPFLRILFLPIQFFGIHQLFKEIGGDRLLVVNGGYPGGETCRVASIVWGRMGRFPGVHNIRNFAIPPRFSFGWIEDWLDREVVAQTKWVVGVSRVCAESLRVRRTYRDLKNIRHIYNGIGVNSSQYFSNRNIREELSIGSNPMCLMLATYEPRKGHHFLFKAFLQVLAQFPKAHLVICGGGTPTEIEVVNRLREKVIPSDNIHLLGFIPDGQALISQADILLIASQEFESFGWTAIESMSLGVPVISTNVGGLPEVIGEDGDCGYCIDPSDIQSYAKCINLLLADPALRQAMGERGRKRARKLFSVERMVREYTDLVRAVS